MIPTFPISLLIFPTIYLALAVWAVGSFMFVRTAAGNLFLAAIVAITPVAFVLHYLAS
jgi:hypothetical protein